MKFLQSDRDWKIQVTRQVFILGIHYVMTMQWIYDLSLSSKKRNIIIIKRLVSNISLLVCFDFHIKAN